MTPEQAKQLVAEAAIEYIEWDWVVGVGTGSTANLFIDELAKMKGQIEGTVASSEASAQRLRNHGIKVFELDQVGDLPIYVDGADESTKHLHLIRQLVKLGGNPVLRDGVTTDNGNMIIDVHDLKIDNPVELELKLNQIAGVVTNGLFAQRGADVLLLGGEQGVTSLTA